MNLSKGAIILLLFYLNLNDFKLGKKDSEDFWIQMGEMFVLMRFFAVRNKEGEYLGTLEYVQNIAPIKNLTGEKRLLSD